MDKKGVIFDLDGTLVDSMDVWEKADYMLAKKYNFVPDEEYWQTVTSRSFLEGAEYITTRFNLGKTPEEIVKELFDFAYTGSRGQSPRLLSLRKLLVFKN